MPRDQRENRVTGGMERGQRGELYGFSKSRGSPGPPSAEKPGLQQSAYIQTRTTLPIFMLQFVLGTAPPAVSSEGPGEVRVCKRKTGVSGNIIHSSASQALWRD